MGSLLRLIGRHRRQDGQGSKWGGFSEEQLQMYKDCFKLMDINKDGQLDKNDLRGAFDNVGVLMSESSTVCWERSLDLAPTTTWSRCSRRRWPARATTPTTSLACSSPSRRSPRWRSPPQWRRWRLNPRKTQMPRRRRRRRRRPPSKCHLLTVEAVEKCSKHSFYLRALKITVIRNPFNCV